MKPVITYTDIYGDPTELTAAEVHWFYAVVAQARRVTGYTVDIIPFDHDLYGSKHRDALGCCVTNNPKNPLDENAATYISVDSYFIHEKYIERFEGEPSIESATLEEVIAHEIAHLYVWRHGKKHTRLTGELYEKIKAA